MINAITGDMIRYFCGDVRRINHALKVLCFASLIAGESDVSDREMQIIQAAALLHDIGIHEAEKKYQSTAGRYQEIEGPGIARELLMPHVSDPRVLDRVCFLVGNHHSYKKIDGTDFQILVEADFLVNIFEESLAGDSVRNIRKKIFKTKTGIRLLDEMYLLAPEL